MIEVVQWNEMHNIHLIANSLADKLTHIFVQTKYLYYAVKGKKKVESDGYRLFHN